MVGLRKKVCNWLFAVLVLFSFVYTYIMFLASSNYSNQKSLKNVKLTVLNSFDAEKKLSIMETTEKHKTTTKSTTRMFSTTTSRTASKADLITTKSSTFMNQTTTTLAKPVIRVHRPQLIVGKRLSRFYKGAMVPTLYLRDPVAYKKYTEYLNKREEELPLQTKVVIVFTNHRSGSSFFGELFNQHEDVFYSFEPLIGTSGGAECKNIAQQVSIVKDMARCIVPDYTKIYQDINITKREVWKTRNLYICAAKKFCFIQNTKELCQLRHCPPSTLKDAQRYDCSRRCGQLNPNLVQNDCRQKKMVAIKLIRFCDITKLKFLVEQLKLDLKIIHLVRDPRGIANSRHNLKKNLDLQKSLKFTCEKQLHNIRSAHGTSNQSDGGKSPDWLKGRYKFVRYEDTALDPYRTAEDIYKFVGLKMTDHVLDWIRKNTGVKENSTESNVKSMTEDRKIAFWIKRQSRNPWGHARVSSTIVQKWASNLPYVEVTNIQEVCRETMAACGYKMVTSTEMYLNKTTNYILPVPKNTLP